MKRYPRILILPSIGVLAGVGFFLRRQQLAAAFDAQGLPYGMGWLPLTLLCVLALAGLAVACRFIKCGTPETYTAALRADIFGVVLNVAGAGLMLAGNALALRDALTGAAEEATLFSKLILMLGIVSALCWIVVTAAQYRGKKPTAWAYLLPIIQCIIRLILHFRSWSTDAIILDYCFLLFGEIFLMLGLFYVAGFVFDKGKYRRSVFFCLGTVLFVGIVLADGDLYTCLTMGGGALYLFSHGQMLLRAKEVVQ